MSEPDQADTQANGQMPTVKQLVARVQNLSDAPKPDGRYALATGQEPLSLTSGYESLSTLLHRRSM